MLDALMEGGRTRVRPILMTAIATILALIPLGLGLSQGEIIASELATVVIGGLFTSTFLTLIVIPVVYSLVDDAKVRSRRALGVGDESEAPTAEPAAS
jgi:HAE1 family hydrophobic/amphiphilic exporter-1